jgi:superfamily II DNA helicase RecQ
MKLSVSLQLLDLGQSVGRLGRVISPSKSVYLFTQKNKHTTQKLNVQSLTSIRTHGHGVCARKDSSCLRPLGYCDRQGSYLPA